MTSKSTPKTARVCVLALLLTALTSNSAEALPGPDSRYTRENFGDFNDDRDWQESRNSGGYGGGSRGCSPGYSSNTLSVIEDELLAMTEQPQFSEAERFKEFVTHTKGLASADSKLQSYFRVIGVDPSHASETAALLTATDYSPYISAARQNLGLTQSQSQQLVTRLRDRIIGMASGSVVDRR